jgi:hypothetical protein
MFAGSFGKPLVNRERLQSLRRARLVDHLNELPFGSCVELHRLMISSASRQR